METVFVGAPEHDALHKQLVSFELEFPQVGVLFVILPERSDSVTRDTARSVLKSLGFVYQEIVWLNVLYKFAKAKSSPATCFARISQNLTK